MSNLKFWKIEGKLLFLASLFAITFQCQLSYGQTGTAPNDDGINDRVGTFTENIVNDDPAKEPLDRSDKNTFSVPNDDCSGAIALTVGSSCVNASFSSVGATNSVGVPGPSCGFYAGGDVWFSAVVPASGNIRVEVNGISINAQYAIYKGACSSLTQYSCNQLDPTITISDPALALQTIYIRVWDFNSAAGGTFNICAWEPPVPANDNCANAISVAVGTSCSMNTYTNAYATTEPVAIAPNPSCGFYAGGDVWFKFVAPVSGKMRFEFIGSPGCNPQYAVYSGSCGSFTQVYCGQLNPEYTLVDPSLGGQTLYLRVWDFNSKDGGTFQLCIWEPPVPPNDNCANAITITAGTSCVMNTYTNAYATADPAGIAPIPTCGFYSGGDVWYKFVAPASGKLEFEFAGSLGCNPQYALYSGSCGSFTQVICAQLDPLYTLVDPSLGGQTLYLRIWDYSSEEGGTFSFCVWEPPVPPNDNCANATPLPVGTSCTMTNSTNLYSTSEPVSVAPIPTCGFYAGADVWYTVLVPASGNLNIQVTNITANAQFALYSGTCGSFTQVACAQLTSTLNIADPSLGGQTLYLRVWNFNIDDGGTYRLCSVDPTPGPTINCPPPVTVQCASAIPPHDFAGGSASGNCGATTVTWEGDVISNQTCANRYTITRTYKATDACGSATCAQTITVFDNTPPTISCPPSVTVQCSSAVPAHDFAGGIASDNCGAATVTWVNDVISNQTCANRYSITRTYLATDACGNTATCAQIITVFDNIAPTINCPPPITVQCAGNVPLPVPTSISASDNCGAATVTWVNDVISNQTCANRYTITRTYRATDACGNTATCAQIITVFDNTAPTINCPPPITVQCAGNVPSPAPTSISASDNCGAATVTWVNDVISNQTCANRYTITRTYRATDACGNTATCAQIITVFDNTAPTINCPPPITVQCAGNVPSPAPTGILASDNCGAATVTWVSDVITNQTCANRYTITRTYMATDVCGNTATCTQVITVNDNTAPTIICPAAVTVQCASAVPAHDFAGGSASDNCGAVTVTWISDAISNQTCANKYMITRTYRATDICGNTASCIQIITVNDNTGPTISCPPSLTVQCASAVPNPDIENVTASDNCGAVTVAWVSDVVSNQTCANRFTITRTYMATDACGNSSTCTQIIRVNDDTAPSIQCPGNISVGNDPGACGAIVNFAVTATDNCGTATVSYSKDPGTFFSVGTTTVTVTATDGCGNTSQCSFTVTVTGSGGTGSGNVTLTCPSPISVNNDPAICGARVVYTVGAGDCSTGALVQTAGLPSGSMFPVGVTTNTFQQTDANGHTTTCSFTVTVIDNEKPVINVQNIFRCYTDDNFGCSINLGVTATDNCQVISLTNNAPACFPVGTTTVIWTATDNHGNVATKTQMVTRDPEININICAGPTRTIYRGTTSGVGPFGPQSVNLTATVTGGTPGYAYSWSPSAGLNNSAVANPVANPVSTTTYTLTVTDSKGCTRSLSITVNVLPLSSAVCSGSGNNVKFSVCHIPPGNPSNPQNICVSVNALPAHLTPGSNGHNNCYLGPCDQQCVSTGGGQSFAKGTQETMVQNIVAVPATASEQFIVKAYPNPSANDFGIQVISSSSNEPISVRIMDMSGHVLNVNAYLLKGSTIRVGDQLRGGTYFAEITQGPNRQVVKLVKLN